MIQVYSDGSSNGRGDEPGGFAWLILSNNNFVCSGFGAEHKTTNNRMELKAAISGLKKLQESGLHLLDAEIELISDSKYVLGLASGAYKPSKNQELASQLRELAKQLNIKTKWVKAHSGNKWNEKCDELANRAREELLK